MIARTILEEGSKSPRGKIRRNVFMFDTRRGFIEADMKGLAIVPGSIRRLAQHEVIRRTQLFRLEDRVLALPVPEK
jgi:hypothetical protein